MPDNDAPNPYGEQELNIEEMFLSVPVSAMPFRQRQITGDLNVRTEVEPKEPDMPVRPYDIDFEHLKLLHDKLADNDKPTPEYFNLLRDFTNKEGIIPVDGGYNYLAGSRLDFEDYIYRAYLNVNYVLNGKDYSMFTTSENFKCYLHEIFRNHYNNGYLNSYADPYSVHAMNRECLALYFSLLCPVPSSKDGWISYYTNGADFARGRRSRVKEGKFLRRVFPSMTDAEITAIVASYRERFVEADYELKIGTSRDDFRNVYALPVRRSNDLITTDERKSLANSCMNKFGGSISPVEVYASGDFEIWYMIDGVGALAARTIVCPMHKTHAPIYTSSNGAYEQLKEKLAEHGYSIFEEGGWSGAKLLQIKKHVNEYYIPYVDWHYWAYEKGGHFIISSSDDCDDSPDEDKVITLGNAGGSAIARIGGSSRTRCHCCGERFDEEYMMEGPDGYLYYEDHWNDLFFTSDYDDCVYSRDDGYVYVYHKSIFGVDYQTWTQEQAEDYAVYVELLSRYWVTGDVTEYLDDSSETQYYPTHRIDELCLLIDFITGADFEEGDNTIHVIDEFGDSHYTQEKLAMTKDKEYVWSDEENAFVHVTNFLEQEAA